ncbi:hypothetical protein AYX15_07015 [Cryptococcus neoformans]|nr:hypothetical protein AYX15_07015 [Cryptococcus neoformans var. grubii]
MDTTKDRIERDSSMRMGNIPGQELTIVLCTIPAQSVNGLSTETKERTRHPPDNRGPYRRDSSVRMGKKEESL